MSPLGQKLVLLLPALGITSLFLCVVFICFIMSLHIDRALAPEEPSLTVSVSLHPNTSRPFPGCIYDVNSNLGERVHNESAMPIQCSSVLQTDVVPNSSMADACLSWCRQSLGQGSAFPYAFSPWHYLILTMIRNETSHFDILKTCWKVETASWALKWMPHVWLMYFYSLAYGSISAFTLLYYLLYFNYRPKELGYRKFLQSESLGETSGENSEVVVDRSLYFGVLGTLVEPGFDLLSVLTFLHNGQPFFAMWVILGLVFSFARSWDPFQLKGARAAAESLHQGFQSQELLEHKKYEWTEALVSTTVQVYALLVLDVRVVQLFTVLNLVGGATFSMFVTLPSQCAARWILEAPAISIDLGNTEEVQRAKNMQPWQEKFLASARPVLFAFIVYGGLVLYSGGWREALWLQWGIPWAALVRPVWDKWQQWILVILLLLFRAMAAVVCIVFPRLQVCSEKAVGALEEQGLVQEGFRNPERRANLYLKRIRSAFEKITLRPLG